MNKMDKIDDISQYIGMVDEFGFKNGFGVATYETEEFYSGLWSNDVKEGIGIQIYNFFDIQFRKIGDGTIYYKNGVSYQGTFQDDTKNGEGLESLVNGFKFRESNV